MKTPHVVRFAILAGFLALVPSSRAAFLEDFHFNDSDGTALNAATNSASAHQWVHDTDHVASIQVQSGALNIVKNNTDFVTEGLGLDDVSTGVLWMVAEFRDWAILGAAPDGNNVEEIRFGFMGTEDLTPPPSSTVLAEMMISRNHGASQFQISGSALGAGGTNLAPAAIDFVQDEPFVMAMRVDQTTNTYQVYYQDGSNPLMSLGSGNLEPTRDAIVVRMSFNNFIGDAVGEFANLDRFYISNHRPAGIPEPSTCMLAAFAALGLLLRRRAD